MSFYRWCMRCGAAILFVIAFLQLAIGLIGPVKQLLATTSQMASNLGYVPGDMQLEMQLQMLLNAFYTAAFTFFGALLINRFDLWLDSKHKAEAAE
jgi:hypothetical protein